MSSRPLQVATEAIGTALRTRDQLIVGNLHVHPGKRLKDQLNQISDRYLAITGVKVYDAEGRRLLYEAAVVLVSSAHVVSVTPLSELGETPGEWGPILRG